MLHGGDRRVEDSLESGRFLVQDNASKDGHGSTAEHGLLCRRGIF